MARGKSEPNIEQGKRSANRMPKSFPCTVSAIVPFTHSGCRALGVLRTCQGHGSRWHQRWQEWGSWVWSFAPRRSTPPLEMGLWTDLPWRNGLRHMSRSRHQPGGDATSMPGRMRSRARKPSQQGFLVPPFPGLLMNRIMIFDSKVKRIPWEVTTSTQEYSRRKEQKKI